MSEILGADPAAGADSAAGADPAGGGGAAGADPAATGKWYDGLPTDYRQNINVTKHPTLESYTKSHLSLLTKLGAPAERLLRLPEGDDGWDDVYKKIGRPEAPEGYKFDASKLKDPDAEFIGLLKTAAHKGGLSDRQFNSMFGVLMEHENQAVEKQTLATEKTRLETESLLRKDWGGEYDTNIALANRALSGTLSADEQAALKSLGAYNMAGIAKLAAAAGSAMKESDAPGGGAGGGGSAADVDTAKAAIAAFYADEEKMKVLGDRSHPSRAAFQGELDRLYQVVAGNSIVVEV